MNKLKKVGISFLITSIYMINSAYIVKSEPSKNIYVNARSAIAIDSQTRQILYEKNSRQVIPMASTTKIMTSLVALRYGNLNKKIKISKRAASVHGSQVGYKENEEITLRELLYGLMMRSGNDAAIAIAEGVGGSVENFVKIMNEYAHSIGAFNTHFESPHGLDSENHYCTAYDLAIITANAKKYDDFNQIVSSKSVDGKLYNFTRSYNNINKILWKIPNSNGVKTGYTGNAGKCLVTSIKSKGNDIIIVILNSNTRWNETSKIYNYIKNNYEYKTIFSKGNKVGEIKVDEHNCINLICDEDVVMPIKKNTQYYKKIIKPNLIKKNIQKGETVGYVDIYDYNKNNVYRKALISDKNMEALKFIDKVKNKFKSLKIINN